MQENVDELVLLRVNILDIGVQFPFLLVGLKTFGRPFLTPVLLENFMETKASIITRWIRFNYFTSASQIRTNIHIRVGPQK